MGYLDEVNRRYISTDAGNQLTIGADGKLFVASGTLLMAETSSTPPTEPPPPPPPPVDDPTTVILSREDLEALTKGELEDLAAGMDTIGPINGTGAGGAVLKADLIDAILAAQ